MDSVQDFFMDAEGNGKEMKILSQFKESRVAKLYNKSINHM
jgi:hypothetical protein